MTYTILEHGDELEKAASDLIKYHFPFYEKVWQVFIGNKGNDTIADLPNYPDEIKRKQFAENSYTVLESFYLIEHVLKSGVLEESISEFSKYVEFNKAFILVFALLGRIHDTAIKASEILKYDNSKFKQSIHKFYEARSVVMHGKKVPLSRDELGLLKIPFLKTSAIKGEAWDDKRSLWGDVGDMNSQYAGEKSSDFFYQLIELINNEYAVFYDLINSELKAIPTSLKFVYTESFDLPFSGSCSASPEAVDVYGFKKLNKKI